MLTTPEIMSWLVGTLSTGLCRPNRLIFGGITPYEEKQRSVEWLEYKSMGWPLEEDSQSSPPASYPGAFRFAIMANMKEASNISNLFMIMRA